MNNRIKWIIKSVYFFGQRCLMIIPDEQFIKMKYRHVFGKKINLDNPLSYSEKLNWLKLYDRKPEYSRYVDKLEAKKIAAETIGEEYIIPTIGVWNSFSEIDFDKLPNAFVLKCTHDSGSFILCSDKSKFDYKFAKLKINAEMKRNYHWAGREHQYKDVPRKIIAEPLIGNGQLIDDYKFYLFKRKRNEKI